MGSSGSSAGSLCRFSQSSRTGLRGADCCADAVIGKVAAAPPRRAMNSRLFIVASLPLLAFRCFLAAGQRDGCLLRGFGVLHLHLVVKATPSVDGRKGRATMKRHPSVTREMQGIRHHFGDPLWCLAPMRRLVPLIDL